MSTNALHFQGTSLGLDPAGTTSTTNVAEIISLSGIGGSRETIDVTASDSSNYHREHIAGLKDGNEVSMDIHYIPSNTTQIALVKFLQNSTNATNLDTNAVFPGFRIKWGSGATSTNDVTFLGIPTGFAVTGSVGDKITASVTIKPVQGSNLRSA